MNNAYVINTTNPFSPAVPVACNLVLEKMKKLPNMSDHERRLPQHLRVHCLERLRRLFQPYTAHEEIINLVTGLISNGYAHRNPLTPDFAIKNRKQNLLIAQLGEANYSGMKASLIGLSGIGKSISVERSLYALYSQVIHHSERLLIDQLVWLKIDCPSNPSVKTLCSAILSELDRLLGTSYVGLFSWQNVDDLMIQVAKLLWLHGLGLFIIDNIHELADAQNMVRVTFMDYLNNLGTVLGIPVLLVGTPLAIPVLTPEFLDNMLNWHPLSLGKDWNLFAQALFRYQWTDGYVDISRYISAKLHEISCGIVDVAVKLYISAQQLSISRSVGCLTPEILEVVSNERYLLLKPFLRAFRRG